MLAGTVLLGISLSDHGALIVTRAPAMQIAPSPADSAGADSAETGEEPPIPPNLLESPTKTVPPDTTTGAPRDSSAISLPAQPAEAETLRYVPPGEAAAGSKPILADVPKTEKKRSGLLGLGPAVIILGLVVVHVFVVRTVGD